MTYRGISFFSEAPIIRNRIVAAALLLVVVSSGGVALAETTDDGFGGAVTAYRTGKYSQALERWHRLADEGNPLAQFNVGLLNYEGHGTARSYAQALIWFHAAARQGLAVSYLRLGTMFERGEGVPRDLEQAYLWYTLAVSAFGPGPCRDKALDGRRTLAKNLTEAQVLKVLAESSEWAPGPLGGVGQPCFDTIAVRPVDGMERSVAAANKEPTKKAIKTKSIAAAATKPASTQKAKRKAKQVARARTNKSADFRDTKTAAETTVTPPADSEATAQRLMAKLPAKMPREKAAASRDVAAVNPRNDAGRETAPPLPVVDVAKRKVHTVQPPGSGKIPLVGTSPRPTYTPKKQVAVAKPATKQLPIILMQPEEQTQPVAKEGATGSKGPAQGAPSATAKLAESGAPGRAMEPPAKKEQQVIVLAPTEQAEPVRMPAASMPAAPKHEAVMPTPKAPKPQAHAVKPDPETRMPVASRRAPEVRKVSRPAAIKADKNRLPKKQVSKSEKRTRIARLARSKSHRPSVAATGDSTVYVQLGALSTRKMADNVWRRLRTDNQDIIGGHQRLIVKFQANNGKVLYRLYAGPFDNGGKADAFCNSLKKRSEACFIPPRFRKRG